MSFAAKRIKDKKSADPPHRAKPDQRAGSGQLVFDKTAQAKSGIEFEEALPVGNAMVPIGLRAESDRGLDVRFFELTDFEHCLENAGPQTEIHAYC